MSGGGQAPAHHSPVHLSTALAQRIVDELAPALEENLNLMDADGFIIASRDISRVGTLHPSAREAAARGEVVSVEEATARQGERPGVNLPLTHRGKVVGVVGVTGPPSKVRSLASMLVLTIGLLVEREAELVGESHRDAADREVLARLVYGARPEDALGLLAQRSPVLPAPWLLFAAIGSAQPISSLESMVQFRRGIGSPALVGSLRGVLWVLVSVRGALDRDSETVVDPAADEIVERVSAMLPGMIVVHSGLCRGGAELVREASNLAILSTRTEKLGEVPAGESVHSAKLMRLRLAAAQLPASAAAMLAAVLDGVTPGERETLEAFLELGNAAELARSGYTHRNTVRRRLNSVQERTGYDLRVPAQAAVLALALACADELATSN